ncbi:MAG TPA: dUTP diphosphatase [Candidatus Rifleibacterium sp.]|nr:dUTP diphosphatase [Candidatus Rifleibacterium sp.]HPT45277.1 dUTP diphosphatase [Candidatus Rifleibacterium sp.]
MSEQLSKPSVELQLENCPGVAIPNMATPGSAGYDLCSSRHAVIAPGKHSLIPTGLRISMPRGLEAQIRPRSGLAAKHAVTVLNAPGTVDSDYRGEICVILINHGDQEFVIEPGMRIAQMVFSRVTEVDFSVQTSLSESCRGEGGFGSTGVR